MVALSFALTALVAGLASAKQCQNLTVPVHISARNGVFNVQPAQSNIDATNFILNGVQQGHNATAEVLTGYYDFAGDFDIAATYCAPDQAHGGAPPVLQLLTHGIGFDRSYWDTPFNNYNYSYVNFVTDQYGYATFTWDRFGIGGSGPHDPITQVQDAAEQSALTALTQALYAGSISGVPKFSTIVHGGHSFGSVLSYGHSRDNPSLTQGLILTGFSQNGTFLPYFQLGGNFIAVQTSPLAGQYPAGYFAAGDASGVQTNFFSPGDFDPNILAFATTTGQPVSQGELLTISSGAAGVNPAAVPVVIVTGGRDLPFCGGDCLATGGALPNIPSSSQPNFPNAKAFEADIIPGAGHALNLEYSHPSTYQTIVNFLGNNGLSGGRPHWRRV